MISNIRCNKIIVVAIIICLFGGLLLTAPQVKAESNRDAMLTQIQQLLTIITSLQQQLKVMQAGGNTATFESTKETTSIEAKNLYQEKIPVIKNSALIRNANPAMLYVADGKTYTLRPWDTPMFRWDKSFDFDDDSVCKVTVTYTDKTLYQTYKNTSLERDHIGLYLQAVTEYGALSQLGIDCASDSDEFEASVNVTVKDPIGIGTLKAYSDSDMTSIKEKVTYSKALQKCLRAALSSQEDTTCVWGGVLIADIYTGGEGVQATTAWLRLRR